MFEKHVSKQDIILNINMIEFFQELYRNFFSSFRTVLQTVRNEFFCFVALGNQMEQTGMGR